MKTGIVLHSVDIYENDDRNHLETLHMLKEIHPDNVLLTCAGNGDMKLLQLFSKLEITSYPQIEIGNISATTTAEIAKQAILYLNSPRLYLKIKYTTGIGPNYINDFLSSLVNDLSPFPDIQLYVVSTAAHFFEKSLSALLLDKMIALGLRVSPVFVFANTKKSFDLLRNNQFAAAVEIFPASHFQVQIMPESIHDFVTDFAEFQEYNRDIFITNLNSYEWFTAHLYSNIKITSTTEIAYPLKDRTSIWTDSTCIQKVSRKVNCNDSVYIHTHVNNEIAETTEGDYIKLRQFTVKKL